jgi:lipopolysaccharide export system protein LptC
VSTRLTAVVLLLLVAVIGTGWYLQQQGADPQQTTASRSGPDAFVTGMQLAVMDETGQEIYRIESDTMTHFPEDEHFKLTRPRFDITRPDGTIWHITAEHGQSTPDNDQLWLLGEVDIRRPGTSKISGLHVKTSDILIKPDEEIAETDNAVTITAEGYLVTAVGLKADLRKNLLELRSRVRGTIDAAS